MAKATYKDAGVDLDVYHKSMARLTRLLHRTSSPRVIKLGRSYSDGGAFSGGFAGVFQLDFSSSLFARRYQEPVLVSCTDGVGTKLKVATLTGVHNTIGRDLVAMSVNDAICLGAEPLFFLDYISMSHDDPDLLEQVVEGISSGCLESDCALLGGETAIMPDLYAQGDYDLAGFCVGVVEKSHMLDGHSIAPEDIVIGVASSGLHSNGYSLARKVVFEMACLGVDDFIDELGQTVGQVMLEPTRIYVKPVRKILDYYKVKSVVHGIAHITGGGLRENLERILPVGIEARIERGSWTPAPVFNWIQKLGEIDDAEMERVFNMGIGLVLVVSPYYAHSVQSQLAENCLESWLIGKVAEGTKGAVWA